MFFLHSFFLIFWLIKKPKYKLGFLLTFKYKNYLAIVKILVDVVTLDLVLPKKVVISSL